MAKKIGTKGGPLKDKERQRETKTFQDKSVNQLGSLTEDFKKLIKGLAALNANVTSIKVIEGAQLAHDIKMATVQKGLAEGGEELRKIFEGATGEMSARNEAGLHDISRGIAGLHSLLAGESDAEHQNRLDVLSSNRIKSLMKHRKIIAAQQDFLTEHKAKNIQELTKEQLKAHDELINGIRDNWAKSTNPQKQHVSMLVGTLGGGGAKQKHKFDDVVTEAKHQSIQLEELVAIARGNKLKDEENKRENKGDKSTTKKKAAKLIGGGLGALALFGGLKELGEAVLSGKLLSKLKNAIFSKTTTTNPGLSQKELKAKTDADAKAKAEKIKADAKAKAEKIKADKIKADTKAKAEKAETKAKAEKEAKRIREANNAKKAAAAKKEAAKAAQKRLEKNAAEAKAKQIKDAAQKAAANKGTTKIEPSKASALKKYLRTFSLSELKDYVKTLKGVSSTMKVARAPLLAGGPAGWITFLASLAIQAVAVSVIIVVIDAVIKEKEVAAKAKADKIIKESETASTANISSDFAGKPKKNFKELFGDGTVSNGVKMTNTTGMEMVVKKNEVELMKKSGWSIVPGQTDSAGAIVNNITTDNGNDNSTTIINNYGVQPSVGIEGM